MRTHSSLMCVVGALSLLLVLHVVAAPSAGATSPVGGPWGVERSGPEDVGPSSVEKVPANYVLDDGSAEVQIGLHAGGDVLMLNAFTAVPGREWITHIIPSWGLRTFNTVDIGHLYRVILYEDPNDDGDPTDAVYLTETTSAVTVAHQDAFESVPIQPTRVEGGFFVAALYVGQAPGAFALPIDEGSQLNRSWIAANFEAGGFDVYDLSSTVMPLTGTSFDGNLMLRARGVAEGSFVDVEVTQTADGAPAAGAKVTLIHSGSGNREGTTDRHGRVHFDNLELGWYGAEAERGGLTSKKEYGLLETGASTLIRLSLPVQIALRGRVVDDLNGHGIEGATVDLQESGVASGESTTTDDEGFYVFDVDTFGTYGVRATKYANFDGNPNQRVYLPATSGTVVAATIPATHDLGETRLQTEVVVLLHGIKDSSRLWSDDDSGMATFLRNEGWAVLGDVDLAGCVDVLPEFVPELGGKLCGLSSVKDQVENLEPQLEALPVESFHVVAHSQGGLVARWYAERTTPSVPRIDKLITLGTPHHGSQLAYIREGISVVLGAAALASVSSAHPVLAQRAVGTLFWWEAFNAEFPALKQLQPDSDTIRLLNRGSTSIDDWFWNSCEFDPSLEAYLVPKTEYYSLRGTGGGWPGNPLYIGGAGLLAAWPALCFSSDGIVPEESAYLWNDGTNVLNRSDAEIGAFPTHHKRDLTTALSATPDVQTWVGQVLDGTIVASKGAAPSVQPKDLLASYARLGSFSHALATDSVLVDSLFVDTTDTLLLDWMWVSGEVEVTLLDPTGAVVDSAAAAADPSVTWEMDPSEQLGRCTIVSPASGMWTYTLAAPADAGWHGIVGGWSAFAVPGARLLATPLLDDPYADRRVEIVVNAPGGPVTGAVVELAVTPPSGLDQLLFPQDDGLGLDATAGDGVYTAQLALEPTPGLTELRYQVSASGPAPFHRSDAVTLQIGATTDVAILGPTLLASNSSLRVGDTLDLGATVSNVGPLGSDVRVEIIRADEGERIFDTQVWIDAGGTLDVQATTLLRQEGSRRFVVRAHPVAGPSESDGTNNEAETTVVVGATATGIIGPPESETPSLDGARAGGLHVDSIYPNPFNPRVSVRFRLERGGRVDAAIYDLRGRRVRELLGTTFASGSHEFVWDGRTGEGGFVASGVYVLRLTTAEESVVSKVALIR